MPPAAVTTTFRRRIALLGVLAVLSTGLLGARLIRLTVDRGEALRAKAEARLVRTSTQPTLRGSILDRHGRVLAAEHSSWEFAVDFELITGAWQRRQALRQARSETGRRAWSQLGLGAREAAILERLDEWNTRVEAVWLEAERQTGLDRAELDDDLDAIKRGVGRLAVRVWDQQLSRLIQSRGDDDAHESFRQGPIAEQRAMHVLIRGLSDTEAFPMRKAIHDLHAATEVFGASSDPGFEIRDSHVRERAFDHAIVHIDTSKFPVDLRRNGTVAVEVDGVAKTLIGSTRPTVQAEDVERRPYRTPSGERDLSGYRPGRDSVGSSGVEYAFDERLHGTIGLLERDLASGTTLLAIEPEPGRDVVLALDVALQARLRALLSPELGLLRVQQWHYGWTKDGMPRPSPVAMGTPLRGAAVVVDIETGATLAMVSSPSPGDVEFSPVERALINARGEAIQALSDEEQTQRRALLALAPYTNRVVETAYAPASIVKPLMYVAGVSDGVIAIDEAIECRGWYRCERCKPRCWTWRPEKKLFGYHGALSPVDAIRESCNVYFYTVADRLGVDRLEEWYQRWGIGDPIMEGVARGVRGTFIPNKTAIGRLIFGIGQGSVAWTPLHAAIAYARLARGGDYVAPKFLVDPAPTSSPTAAARTWNARAVEGALQGMRESAQRGTASSIRLAHRVKEPILDFDSLPGGAPTIWAKTGTAQVEGQPSHGWYAGLVAPSGSSTPQYAFAVVIEHGHSGAPSAGPVAAQLIRQLAAEGYLGREATAGSTPVEWVAGVGSP